MNIHKLFCRLGKHEYSLPGMEVTFFEDREWCNVYRSEMTCVHCGASRTDFFTIRKEEVQE